MDDDRQQLRAQPGSHEEVYRAIADALGVRFAGEEPGPPGTLSPSQVQENEEIAPGRGAPDVDPHQDVIALQEARPTARGGLLDALAMIRQLLGGDAVRLTIVGTPAAPHGTAAAFALYRALFVFLAAKAPFGAVIGCKAQGERVAVSGSTPLDGALDEASRSRRFFALAAAAGLSLTRTGGGLAVAPRSPAPRPSLPDAPR